MVIRQTKKIKIKGIIHANAFMSGCNPSFLAATNNMVIISENRTVIINASFMMFSLKQIYYDLSHNANKLRIIFSNSWFIVSYYGKP